ncbi:dynein light chain roadblock-type 2 [Eurytemora carolleeae]|uniref:dynein light chain roadblock-type 2 n=1 Tax=Eurytemora carolleeae TaxID=1294199 RepID=UPI000C76ED97|nr:dynein light chain roadblock-type 2 [Eurytemora carolleeae]|eukprot:XP_023321886.1 dynein light chain roadblock-type 2-like [Eurytemora affinis]
MEGSHTTMNPAKSMAPGSNQHIELNSEMDEVVKRIQSSKNVSGVMVISNEGIPLKTTLDNSTTVQYGGMVSQLAERAKSVVRKSIHN